ncbi:CGI121 family protein [Schizosaccharomyces japonicus yFS275]|uniref:EKC/KEOPS complex subunit CGI121 n=1 Tax=Schizosaccharomyces japonicus (strain yFS275 / FY16936) TaxID=402676 RepID=B6K673_SCHJY|nr:CGI121 family protein [Schizosaccharomyces japonicus yFS275]EEB09027.1 CGI121 family protein [Schizosaccharomyces japonicus yFS275]
MSTTFAEDIALPMFPNRQISVAVFKDVTNASEIHRQIISLNKEYDYAFIDAGIIVCRQQLFAAIIRALRDQQDGLTKTKTIHSEIILSLCPRTEISTAFRNFGISKKSTSLVIVKVGASAAEIGPKLRTMVEGTPIAFSQAELDKLVVRKQLVKNYKLDASKPDTHTSCVLAAIALRGYN